jgi:hypothetical protein
VKRNKQLSHFPRSFSPAHLHLGLHRWFKSKPLFCSASRPKLLKSKWLANGLPPAASADAIVDFM